MLKPVASTLVGILFVLLINSHQSSAKRTITYVNIDGLQNGDHHLYSINERFKRDLDNQPSPKNPSLIDDFTRPFNTTEIPEFPHEITQEEQKKSNITTDNHTYYNITYIYDQAASNSYWINMKALKDSVRHEMLSNAHRRAATVRLSFKFPFYGYKIENLTIATGGFLFLGEAGKF